MISFRSEFKIPDKIKFPLGFTLSVEKIGRIVAQMDDVFTHFHSKQVCHGDLYAHNTLFDDEANIIVGDFGAATMYHMLNEEQQLQVKQIERLALHYFIDDLLSVCREEDKNSQRFIHLKQRVAH